MTTTSYSNGTAGDDVTADDGVKVKGEGGGGRVVREEEGEEIKVGDVEKEKQIELRMRELGLWESKKELERRVAAILDCHISDTDVLTRTLRQCRRSRDRSSVEDVRNLIQPQVIRDCYGQSVAYRVHVLMGHFTRDVTHETDNAARTVTIRGSTAPGPDRQRPSLEKEIRVELPAACDASRLDVRYAAGVVKIVVPFLRSSYSGGGGGRAVEEKGGVKRVEVSGVGREVVNEFKGAGDGNNNLPPFEVKSVSSLYAMEKRYRLEKQAAAAAAVAAAGTATTAAEATTAAATSSAGPAAASAQGVAQDFTANDKLETDNKMCRTDLNTVGDLLLEVKLEPTSDYNRKLLEPSSESLDKAKHGNTGRTAGLALGRTSETSATLFNGHSGNTNIVTSRPTNDSAIEKDDVDHNVSWNSDVHNGRSGILQPAVLIGHENGTDTKAASNHGSLTALPVASTLSTPAVSR